MLFSSKRSKSGFLGNDQCTSSACSKSMGMRSSSPTIFHFQVRKPFDQPIDERRRSGEILLFWGDFTVVIRIYFAKILQTQIQNNRYRCRCQILNSRYRISDIIYGYRNRYRQISMSMQVLEQNVHGRMDFWIAIAHSSAQTSATGHCQIIIPHYTTRLLSCNVTNGPKGNILIEHKQQNPTHHRPTAHFGFSSCRSQLHQWATEVNQRGYVEDRWCLPEGREEWKVEANQPGRLFPSPDQTYWDEWGI